MERSTWVEIDAGALEKNFGIVSTHAGVPICAVVKANGYGHGIEIAARVFARAGASMLGVTKIEEARALRSTGIDARLLILAPVPDVQEAITLDSEISVGTAEEISSLPKAARAHLIVDTGMGRLGVKPAEAVAAARSIAERAHLESVWTHFANAAGSSGRKQLARFRDVTTSLRAASIVTEAHASNSAGLLALPDARFEMVRIGTLLYGMNPPGVQASWALNRAFDWFARVVAVRSIPAGATVGYGSEYRARRETRIATIPVGYADGFTLEPAARTESVGEAIRAAARIAARATGVRPSPRAVFFDDRRAPVIGRVGMQLTTVNVTDLPDVVVGSVARIPARALLVNPSIERIEA